MATKKQRKASRFHNAIRKPALKAMEARRHGSTWGTAPSMPSFDLVKPRKAKEITPNTQLVERVETLYEAAKVEKRGLLAKMAGLFGRK